MRAPRRRREGRKRFFAGRLSGEGRGGEGRSEGWGGIEAREAVEAETALESVSEGERTLGRPAGRARAGVAKGSGLRT